VIPSTPEGAAPDSNYPILAKVKSNAVVYGGVNRGDRIWVKAYGSPPIFYWKSPANGDLAFMETELEFSATPTREDSPTIKDGEGDGGELRLEAGKFYQSEKGVGVGPIELGALGRFIGGHGYSWEPDGSLSYPDGNTAKDCGRLLHEVPDPNSKSGGDGSAEAASPQEAGGEVEKVWREFWREIVTRGGRLDVEQIKKELFDFHIAMQNVPRVYSEVTGGQLSKITYPADVVIREARAHYERCLEDERKEWEAEPGEASASPLGQIRAHGEEFKAWMKEQKVKTCFLPADEKMTVCFYCGHARDAHKDGAWCPPESSNGEASSPPSSNSSGNSNSSKVREALAKWYFCKEGYLLSDWERDDWTLNFAHAIMEIPDVAALLQGPRAEPSPPISDHDGACILNRDHNGKCERYGDGGESTGEAAPDPLRAALEILVSVDERLLRLYEAAPETDPLETGLIWVRNRVISARAKVRAALASRGGEPSPPYSSFFEIIEVLDKADNTLTELYEDVSGSCEDQIIYVQNRVLLAKKKIRILKAAAAPRGEG
jgi:hypothetical protein